jgi:PKD repeat protein
VVAVSAAMLSLLFGTVNVSADFCTDLQGDFGSFLDCENHFSSFTDFDGGLDAPEADGFDDTITQSPDLRTFIERIANFVLSFLGVIAILIIIYSGFLYVTARGEQDQMDKGKKGIVSAVIGIVIILSSFAIVNTVIQAPSGDGRNIQPDGGVVSGVGPGGVTNATQLASFNSAAEEIKDVAVEFVKSYERNYKQSVRLSKLTTVEPEEWTSRSDFVEYLNYLKDELRRVERNSGTLSKASIAARLVIDTVIDPGIQAIGERVEREEREEFENEVLDNNTEEFFNSVGRAIGDFGRNVLGSEDGRQYNYECALPPSERSVDFNVSNCDAARRNLDETNLGGSIDSAFDQLINDVVLDQGVFADYNEDIELFENRIENIRLGLVSFNGRDAGITTAVDDLFEPVLDAFSATSPESVIAENVFFDFTVSSSSSDFSDIASRSDAEVEAALAKNERVRDLLIALDDLHEELLRIKFTAPFIEARPGFTGSAPLIVTFDGTRSYDPSDQTIPNENYHWDLDGDGDFDNTTSSINDAYGVDCFEEDGDLNKAEITCIYTQPGSYRVALQVDSTSEPDEEFVAAGISYASVRVTPPVSRINLVANINGREEVLRKYNEEDGTLERDVSDLYVTTSEAISGEGIEFDASGTTGNKIINYEWLFTNTGDQIAGSGQQTVVQKNFTEPGVYDGVLIVTDESGNQDRKSFRIHVTSIVARITAESVKGVPGTEFEFSAAASQSDSAPIKDFVWTVDGETPAGVENSEETFKYTFNEPGEHEVGLVVSNGDNEDDTSIEIEIESQAPQAAFTATKPLENRPSYVVLDATRSFDPDPNDVLDFNWDIPQAQEGVNYEIVEGSFDGNEEEAGRLVVVFKEKGNYTIELKVSDQHSGNLRKSSTVSSTVVIDSVIDVAFAEDQVFAGQLAVNEDDDLVAEVEFVINTEFGELVAIDFGDGEKDEKRVIDGQVTFDHEYTKAGSYEVKATARKGSDRTTVSNTFIVGGGENTIAVPKIIIGDSTFTNTAELPEVFRNTTVTFDASSSLNADGEDDGLSYSWNFGDGRISTQSVVRHTYRDLPPVDPGYFEVSLTVTSEDGDTDTAEIELVVVGAKPEAQSLIATPQGGPETPFTVKLEVVGPYDADGRVVQYTYYYFPIDEPERKLGTKVSEEKVEFLEVKTFGIQGEEREYVFCVDMKDDDGNEVVCDDIFAENARPSLNVINGPNEPPLAKFQANPTNVNVGETVNFFDESRDEDGEILEWTYDFDGDNSFVNDETYEQPNISHVYTRAGTYRVRLRVLDDKGALAVSQPVNIFVDSILDDPTAAFTFTTEELTASFRDNSQVDFEKGGTILEHQWDFDLATDSDGDGNPANDIDSDDAEPTFTYDNSGTYQVKLIITDSEYNKDEVVRSVIIQEIPDNYNNPFENDTTPPDVGGPIPAPGQGIAFNLSTSPAIDLLDDTIYLSGNEANVTFNFDQLPAGVSNIIVDKNIYFDTNSGAMGTIGDGVRNNDVDYTSNSKVPYTTNYMREWSPIRVQVTVIDANGNQSRDEADIVFRSNDFQAFLSGDSGNAWIIYLSLAFGALLYGAYTLNRNQSKSKKTKLN